MRGSHFRVFLSRAVDKTTNPLSKNRKWDPLIVAAAKEYAETGPKHQSGKHKGGSDWVTADQVIDGAGEQLRHI